MLMFVDDAGGYQYIWDDDFRLQDSPLVESAALTDDNSGYIVNVSLPEAACSSGEPLARRADSKALNALGR